MSDDRKLLEKMIDNALSGKGAHVATKDLFEGLDWKVAGTRSEGAPHSLFQLLNHLSYWQDWAVKWLDGGSPTVPKHAAGGWPGSPSPTSAKEWQRAVRGFRGGLARLARQSRAADLLTTRGEHSRLGMLQAIASHNSYHAGQVVVLRQMLGKWPPPSGGVTW
ncbi:MAG: DinB family protein [Terriglobia bacterium]|jgi:uncharacterized damage-inducible protein DinB